MQLLRSKDLCHYCSHWHQQWQRFEDEVDNVVPLCNHSLTVPPLQESATLTVIKGMSSDGIRAAQEKDPDLSIIFQWLEREPSNNDLSLQGSDTRAIWRNKENICINDGVLCVRWLLPDATSMLRMIVPRELRDKLLKLVHDSPYGGHWGRPKTLARIQQSFYWPSMSRDVDLYIKTCSVCSLNKKSKMPRAALLHYQAGEPNERVHLDFLGPFEVSTRGNKYVLSIIDQFTWWIEVYALPEQTAEITANTFFTGWVSRFGVPKIVHTDQGRNFTSHLFENLCDNLDCVKTRTTPYRPSSNGQVERYNRMILSFIRCFVSDTSCWDDHLPMLAMSLRSTVNRTTGYTANMLQLGREVRMPWDVVFLGNRAKPSHQSTPEFVRALLDRLHRAFNTTRGNIRQAQVLQKKGYDSRAALREIRFDIGDLVYTMNTSIPVGRSQKLQPIMKGPFIITKVLSPALYVVRGRKRSQVLHHDRLLLCEDRDIPLWVQKARTHILDQGKWDSPSEYAEDNDPTPFYLHTLFEGGERDFVGGEGGTARIQPNTALIEPDTAEGLLDAHSDCNEVERPQHHSLEDGVDEKTQVEEQSQTTRTGRKVKAPRHLQDYIR